MAGLLDGPSAAVCYDYSHSKADGKQSPITPSQTPVTLLRPVLDLLVLAALLLPWKLWWHLADPRCPNPSRAEELVLLRVTRGVWIAWLTHAAGVLDEALRVFIGIRLTQGLGSPTSVDTVYSKLSRWAEVVAEGIATDDFPALVGLYAGSRGPARNKRASSGDVGAELSGAAAARRRHVNKSLVMSIERLAATANVWSLTPWSRVRRYKRVHVKGITLRLRQVNGILNFSFLALKKKGKRCAPAAAAAATAATTDASGENAAEGLLSRGAGGISGSGRGGRVGGGIWARGQGGRGDGFGGALRSGGMDDLDGIDDDEAGVNDTEDDSVEEEGNRGSDSSAEGTLERMRRFSDLSLDGAGEGSVQGLFTSRAANGARKASAPWATVGIGGGSKGAYRRESGGGEVTSGAAASPCRRRGSGNLGHHGSDGERRRSISLSVHQAQQQAAEPNGNLGVIKVLGEAFMRRFNAYCEQVSAAFGRMADIKLVPKLWHYNNAARQTSTSKGGKRRKRFEVGEIFLEEVCVCVDAGVWNDLLGDQVGAAFSPEFRVELYIGPQELATPNGEGRFASEIGMMVSDRLVRLLARLVMRETLKTSTLTSMVITSLALDTDARSRRQSKHHKLQSPPPVTEDEPEDERNSVARAAAAVDDAYENKPGKFWRPPLDASSPSPVVAGPSPLRPANGVRYGHDKSGCGGGPGVPLAQRSSGLEDMCSTKSANVTVAEAKEAMLARSGSSHPGRRRRRVSDGIGHSDFIVGSRHSSFASSEASSFLGVAPGGGEKGGRRSRRLLGPRRSLPNMGKPGRGWRRTSDPTDPERSSKSPPPPPPPVPLPTSRRRRPTALEVLEPLYGGMDFGRKPATGAGRGSRGRKGAVERVPAQGSKVTSGGGRGDEEEWKEAEEKRQEKEFETVARAPPWMEGVEAYAQYEEMKPTLDVIKRTVLLAVLQESNRSADMRMNSSFTESEIFDEKLNGRSWNRRQGAHCKRVRSRDNEQRALEWRLHEELLQAREAGSDVDRLVMTQLLARVRETGPNTAFRALASIELSSFIENLAAGTRLAQTLENVGVDMSHVAEWFEGMTAGEIIEGVRDTAGKVGGEARRLRTEAARVHKALLDEIGILPLLSDVGAGKEATTLACAVGSLSDTLTAAGGAAGSNVSSPFAAAHKDSWERGVAVSKDPNEEEHSINNGANGDAEEVDEVDVIMQVLDLMEAVESLKVGIMNGDGVALNKVEQAVGKAVRGVDVYLVLAASESMLGFLLERLGKLPVGHAKFGGKGFECRVHNLDLKGVRVTRENVDLVMKGFRLPKRGTPVMTQLGRGKIKRYKKRSRCFVVNLDWTMSNGKPVKAYLQPNDIVVLQGHEGELSDEECEEEDIKVTVDRSEPDVPAEKQANGHGGSSGGSSSGGGGGQGSETSVSPPQAEDKGRFDRRRWPAIRRPWNRRRSAGIVEGSLHGQGVDDDCESRERVNDCGASSDARSETGSCARSIIGRSLARRVASAPAIVSSPLPVRKPPRRVSRAAEGLSSTFTNAGPPPLLVARGPATDDARSGGSGGSDSGVNEADSGPDGLFQGDANVRDVRSSSAAKLWRKHVPDEVKDASSSNGAEAGHVTVGGDGAEGRSAAPEREEDVKARQEAAAAGGERLAKPLAADILSAPFLVARVSGVGAEMKNVMWSVKQTHFPYLRTAGSLEATVSGLTIELELDTAGAHMTATSPSSAEDDGSGSDAPGSRTPPDGDQCEGGLRLTRLRVSVRKVKVHVSDSALSAVYNLAASAFQAAVKRHVVESVEAAVRKSLTTLLSILHRSEKWKILCRVSSGSSGGTDGADSSSALGASGGDADAPESNAVDRVLAKSFSHHVVWAAGHRRHSHGRGSSTSSTTTTTSTRSVSAGVGQSTRRDRTGSGASSRSSTEAGTAGERSASHRSSSDEALLTSDGGGGGGGGGGNTAARRPSLAKRLFRPRSLGAVGRSRSAEELSSSACLQSTRGSSSVRQMVHMSSAPGTWSEERQETRASSLCMRRGSSKRKVSSHRKDAMGVSSPGGRRSERRFTGTLSRGRSLEGHHGRDFARGMVKGAPAGDRTV